MRGLAVVLALAAATLLLTATGYGSTAASAPPETTITGGPPDPTNERTVSFRFTSNDPAATFGCALGQEAFQTCTSPASYDNLPDGRYTFFVVAVGSDGTSDPTPASWVWTIDREPPLNVSNQHMVVRYGRLDLSWRLSSHAGAVRVIVLRSDDPRKQPARQVYSGTGDSYTDTRFANGFYHRYRIASVDQAGNVASGVTVIVRPSALLLAPAEGAQLRSAPALAWIGVPSARYYNAQLFLGTRKVLSAWPRSPYLRLGRTWSYNGHSYRLAPGQYTWYVWPGFGPRARGTYGQLVGQSSFQVVG